MKQCYGRSSVEKFWGYLQLIFKLISAEISCKYHQIVSIEDRAKHCFKNEWTLVVVYERVIKAVEEWAQ